MWRPILALWAIALVGAAAAGCGGARAGEGAVEFRRSGGIAGETVALTVDADGEARIERDGRTDEFRLDAHRLRELRAALDDIDLAALSDAAPGSPSAPNGKAGGGGRDLFEYEVTYRGHVVRARDTEVPEELVPLLELLNEIVAERARS